MPKFSIVVLDTVYILDTSTWPVDTSDTSFVVILFSRSSYAGFTVIFWKILSLFVCSTVITVSSDSSGCTQYLLHVQKFSSKLLKLRN